MIIQIRPGEPMPRPDWAEVETVEVLERFDRDTMGPFIVEALDNNVRISTFDPDVLKAIERFIN